MPTKRKHDKKKGKPVKDLSKSKIIDLDVIVEANSQVGYIHFFMKDSLAYEFRLLDIIY